MRDKDFASEALHNELIRMLQTSGSKADAAARLLGHCNPNTASLTSLQRAMQVLCIIMASGPHAALLRSWRFSCHAACSSLLFVHPSCHLGRSLRPHSLEFQSVHCLRLRTAGDLTEDFWCVPCLAVLDAVSFLDLLCLGFRWTASFGRMTCMGLSTSRQECRFSGTDSGGRSSCRLMTAGHA